MYTRFDVTMPNLIAADF